MLSFLGVEIQYPFLCLSNSLKGIFIQYQHPAFLTLNFDFSLRMTYIMLPDLFIN
jgi:hypothetical protein